MNFRQLLLTRGGKNGMMLSEKIRRGCGVLL
jgi:hypothetical protein